MMNPAEHQPTASHGDQERRQLAAWLREWAIERLLPADSDPTGTQHRHDGATETTLTTSVPGEGCIGGEPPMSAGRLVFSSKASPSCRRKARCAPGHIRLIHPADNGRTCLPPLYVAVLAAAAPADWLVVPFGRFSTPAIASEWRTGLKAVPLRVLCFWNVRQAPARAIERRSWCAGSLSTHLLARAQTLYARSSRQDNRTIGLPGPVLRRHADAETGPPLTHPLDPRWIYLTHEADRIEATFASAGLTRHSTPRGCAPAYYGFGDSMLKAAEDKSDYHGPA